MTIARKHKVTEAALAAAACVFVCTAAVARADRLVHRWTWQGPGVAALPPGVEVVPPGGETAFASVKVVNTTAQPRSTTIAVLDQPDIAGYRYALRGKVRYEDVQPPGYLEMWSQFPGGGRYFTRTLAPTGAMGRLSGSAEWRVWELPFVSNAAAGCPLRLTINVLLPGRGTVHVGPMELVELARPWWSDSTGGWVGGGLGSLVGLLGTCVLALAFLGRARRLAIGLTVAAAVSGLPLLGVGIAAAVTAQPYAVYYPLMLCGGMLAASFGVLLPLVRRRYQQIELRRMAALDA